MTTTSAPRPSPACFLQSALSFGIAVLAVGTGIAYLPVSSWMRAFLAIGLLYVVTSCFTLAKCVRDHQEAEAVTSRVDQARLDKILSEHDPFGTP